MSEVVTITTPINPPIQTHHGNSLGLVVKFGGKLFVATVMINSAAVPTVKEISDA